MEFSFDVNHLFPETITRSVGGGYHESHDKAREEFAEVIDKMGKASAEAQGLRAPITTLYKLQLNKETLYILKGSTESGKGVVVGIIKVGKRKLFLSDGRGIQHEVEPLCVLDFYVHESRQRSGCGKKLYAAMVEGEAVKPFEVAIDRPSSKFLSFLKKHYKLHSYVHQANHFVVFDEFFKTCKSLKHSSRKLKFLNSTAPQPTPRLLQKKTNPTLPTPPPPPPPPQQSPPSQQPPPPPPSIAAAATDKPTTPAPAPHHQQQHSCSFLQATPSSPKKGEPPPPENRKNTERRRRDDGGGGQKSWNFNWTPGGSILGDDRSGHAQDGRGSNNTGWSGCKSNGSGISSTGIRSKGTSLGDSHTDRASEEDRSVLANKNGGIQTKAPFLSMRTSWNPLCPSRADAAQQSQHQHPAAGQGASLAGSRGAPLGMHRHSGPLPGFGRSGFTGATEYSRHGGFGCKSRRERATASLVGNNALHFNKQLSPKVGNGKPLQKNSWKRFIS